ncbi:O-antigen ligase family protein [Virgibacillus kekensis]|uniref:O-antigen ligase family protein n=1 Tax=Virgibacillus kekensis TaxID=202261 RepID=A0ABV9DGI8_9BACI
MPLGDSMVIYKKQFYKNMIFFLLLLSILFRGPTFFKIFSSSFGEIRISYLLLFFLSFVVFFILKHKITIIEFIIFVTIFITILLNMLLLQTYNIEYLVYVLQAFAYYYILSALVRLISINELYKKCNIMLIVFGIMSVYEILTGKLFFHIVVPYEINSFSIYERAYLFFYNGNNLSLFLLSLYVIVLGYNLIEKNKTKYLLAQQVLLFFIFIMNDSKLSLVVFLVTTALFFIKKYTYDFKRKNWKLILYGICSVFIIMLLIKNYFDSNIHFINVFFDNAQVNITNDPRFDLYSNAIQTFYSNPLGIGLGNSDYYFSTNVHSIIIQFIVEIGIFGLIFWILYYFFVLKDNLKNIKYNDKFMANVIRYYVVLFPIISMQVSRVISDNALVFMWALFLVLLKYYTSSKFEFRKETLI